MFKKDRFSQPREGFKMGAQLQYAENWQLPQLAKGEFILEMHDAATGELLHYFQKKNIITLDAGIQAARYFKDKDEPANSANMLAIGTGATGALLSPDAPDSRQRKLNAEIARKAFSSTTFRDTSGNAVAIPTNIVDFTTSYGEGEAVGPLTEMGIVSTISSNPLITNPNPNVFPTRDTSLDLSQYDVLINYLTFPVVTKPSTAVLTITWRLSF
jgi:hypothetical protein